jgi:hypothetical protein
METIFDYNPTQGELNHFGLTSQSYIDFFKKEFLPKSPDSRYYQLGMLFAMRGDNKKADVYWSKVKDVGLLSTLVEDF